MGKLSRYKFIALPIMALMLCSCTIFDLVGPTSSLSYPDVSVDDTPVEFEKNEIEPGVYTAPNFNKVSYRDIGLNRGMDLVPSTGDIKVLVLPIQFTDYAFSNETLSNINLALNGSGPEETGYWESVSSFYKKSSFGKLNLSFEMAPIYDTGITSKEALKLNLNYTLCNETTNTNGQKWVNEAVANYSSSASPLTDFDSDSNGIIDAVIAIYSCPDYSEKEYYFTYGGNTYKDGKGDSSLFWAYTYWCSNNGDLSSPKANTYVWLSYDFFSSGGKADAHTLIHEYGHAMGLDDYYSNESTFQPAGGIDMMDLNIADHDVFSKMALGWVSPTIISSDNVSWTLGPSSENGQCLLIAPSTFNGTVWDEYILIELYTPDGLNAYDATHVYPGRSLAYTVPGLKIYHIDARLVECRLSNNLKSVVATPYVRDPNSLNLSARNAYYLPAATNCSKSFNSEQILPSNTNYSKDYSLIHLLEASGFNTFANGRTGTNSTLFKEGNSFSMSKFGARFFVNGNKLNNGASFPYTIEVESLSSSSAKVNIKAVS